MMIFGFDFGTKKIGIATGQTITRSANPLTVISATDGVPDWQQLKALIDAWRPEAFVVGCALHVTGEESDTSKRARAFGETLTEQFGLPTHFVDEHLTSFTARQLVKEGAFPKDVSVDAVSAMLILETWLKGGALD